MKRTRIHNALHIVKRLDDICAPDITITFKRHPSDYVFRLTSPRQSISRLFLQAQIESASTSVVSIIADEINREFINSLPPTP